MGIHSSCNCLCSYPNELFKQGIIAFLVPWHLYLSEVLSHFFLSTTQQFPSCTYLDSFTFHYSIEMCGNITYFTFCALSVNIFWFFNSSYVYSFLDCVDKNIKLIRRWLFFFSSDFAWNGSRTFGLSTSPYSHLTGAHYYHMTFDL